MQGIGAAADRLRDAALQPAADRIDDLSGLNCFRVAGALCATFVAVEVAVTAHLAATGRPVDDLVARCAFPAAAAVVALGLDTFGRRAPAGAGDVTHPFLRGRAAWCLAYLGTCVGGIAYACCTAGGLAPVETAWHVARWGDDALLALGLCLATCAWRRPTRARATQPAAAGHVRAVPADGP